MEKKEISEKIREKMATKVFSKSYLNFTMIIAFLLFALSIVFFVLFDVQGGLYLLTCAQGLTYSALSTVSLSVCGYWGFRKMAEHIDKNK